jgi:Raf kinase inhibitor-like YbhB/YbcL family protein
MVAPLTLLASCGAATEADMADFMLKSDAFAEGQALPTQFTCDGADQSPPLSWSEPPGGTKSFALIVDDPDAPSGTFSHWAAFNIPASTRNLAAGAGNKSEAPMAQARNDFGNNGYGGACPPQGHGPHRYRFKLLALDVDRLNVPSEAKARDVEAQAEEHLVARAELMGTYERK